MQTTFTDLKDKSIGEVVTNHPELVKVFIDYGVDFCCGGDRLVMEAVERDTDDIDGLMVDADKAIEAAKAFAIEGSRKTLAEFTTEQLIDLILQKHHKYLRETLPKLSELLFKLLEVHGDNHPELFEIHKVFGGLKIELESHLVKEEKQLFPELIKGGANCKLLIETLEAEHDVAGDALHTLTDLTGHFSLPSDACTTYGVTYRMLKELVSDMYMHVHTENNVLFKRFN